MTGSPRWLRSRARDAALGAVVLCLVASGSAGAVTSAPGSPGLGDPFFPDAGNGGYDVSHYSLTLDYAPTTNNLTGTAVITATATQNLSRFDLDLRGFTVSRVLVDGKPASQAREGAHELVVTPKSGLRAGRSFTVTVDYAGTPQVVTDPDGSVEGWVPTDDGAFVVGRAPGLAGLVPGQRQPPRQGDLRLQRHRPRGAHRDGERRARLERVERREDEVGLAGDRPDGAVPRDGDARPLRPDRLGHRRHPVVRRDRPDAPERERLPEAPRDRAVLRVDLRAVPVQRRGVGRGRREGRRVLARDPDQAGLRGDARRDDGRPRDLAHVVRRLGHPHAVARHLAARGLRDLVGVDLERALRPQDRAAVLRQPLQHAGAGHRLLDAAARQTRARRPTCSTARSTTGAR